MSDRPVPSPTPETLPFWESVKAREMKIQYCLSCDDPFFYPRSYCPRCHSSDLEWRTVSGRATLESYVINRRPLPAFGTEPQVIALVVLSEGPRMMTNIVGASSSPDSFTIGMQLELTFEERGEYVLPVFTPASEVRR